jgi:hypothetical protein
MILKDYLEFLSEFEAICETALARESRNYEGLIDEKKTEGQKFHYTVPFRVR